MEKRVPFRSVGIDLRDKPDWYLELVPTGLVPAIRIKDKVTYESSDILMALEEYHTDTPLLPSSGTARSGALRLMEEADAEDSLVRVRKRGREGEVWGWSKWE